MRYAIGATSALLVTVLGASGASAGSMRCAGHIIDDSARRGAGMYEVLKKCGEPTERLGYTWVYDRGQGSKKVVTFDGSGRVVSIR